MKKLILALAVVATLSGLSSCSSIRHTATIQPIETSIESNSTADLAVSPQKISFKYYPSKAVRRNGEKATIKTAVAQALKENGNADVLVAFQYEIKKTRGLFGTSIKYVVVEGYPATYKNVRPIGPRK